MASAVNDFVIEAIRKTLRASAGIFFSRLAKPTEPVWMSCPSRTRPHTRPGACFSAA